MSQIPFEKFGIMVDCSRNAVLKPQAFQRLVDIISRLGYNQIMLYTEDTYEVEGEPYFGYMRGRYALNEIKALDEYTKSKGVELVPCIQTLAHLGTIFRYAPYGEIRDVDDILFVGEERTYQLIDNMFASIAKAFTSRRINIGMDEAFMLGRGKYQDKNGCVPKAEIMRAHLEKVLAIADKYGFQCQMFSDMFMHAAYGDVWEFTKDDSENVKKCIPENLSLIDWDYYHTGKDFYANCIDKHKQLSNNVVFAGGAWTWLGFCPNNSFSIKSMTGAMEACKEKGIKEVFITLWGDNGGECSPFGVLPTLVTLAEYVKGNVDEDSVKEKFKEVVGIDYDLFCLLEQPDKVYSTDEADTYDPSKVMLYSDVFSGLYDACVKEGVAPPFYQELSKRLREGETHAEWGYLFSFTRALCDVLEIKFDLGLQTRKAYKEKDEKALRRLAEEVYPLLIDRIEEFYRLYEECWNTEKKPHGFDVQDARIGGLIMRIKHLKARLLRYLNGKEENIPELEQELLLPFGYKEVKGIAYNYYGVLITANVI